MNPFMISWNTCYASVAGTYFNTHYQGVLFVIMATVCLLIHLLCQRKFFKNMLGQYHEQVNYVSLHAAAIILVIFLLYWTFIFKPDMTQIIIEQLRNTTVIANPTIPIV